MMKYFLLCALVLVFPAPGVLAQHGSQPMHQRFDDAERWAKVFDDPARDAWQKPDEVIRALRLPAEASVADLGAGTGYFAVRLARDHSRAAWLREAEKRVREWVHKHPCMSPGWNAASGQSDPGQPRSPCPNVQSR